VESRPDDPCRGEADVGRRGGESGRREDGGDRNEQHDPHGRIMPQIADPRGDITAGSTICQFDIRPFIVCHS
jgi:hypothetical protein